MQTQANVAAVLVCLCGLVGSAVAQQAPPDRVIPLSLRPTLTVTGQGEVQVEPDRAIVRLGALAQAPDAQAAQTQVNQIMQGALDKIKALGIPEAAIKTVGLSLSPVYSNPPMRPGEAQPEPKIVAYRAQNTIQVQTDDLKLIGRIIDTGISAGANQLQGISFDLKDDTEARKTALRRAVGEAREKADAIAAAAGVHIEAIQEITEGGVNRIRPQMEFAARGGFAAAATPVQAGQVRVQASVTMQYRIAGNATGAQ